MLVRFLCQRACGVPDIPGQDTIVRRLVTLAPFARGTLDVATIAGLADEEFATIIEVRSAGRRRSDDDLGRAPPTAATPRPRCRRRPSTWYLAEGATINGFKLFYLLQNPNAVEATVTVEYLLGRGLAPVTVTYTLAPQSRTTLDVSTQHPSLRAAEVSARIVTDAETPILVERAMYLNAGGRLFGAGHVSAGITTPAPMWSFAEGATGPYFDTFLLIANPSSETRSRVRATFLLPTGATVQRTYDIAAKSRFNIWVDQAAPELADTAVSTVLESVEDQPFVAERAMWWPGPASAQLARGPQLARIARHERHVGPGRRHGRRRDGRRHLRARRQHVAVRRARARHAVVRGRRRRASPASTSCRRAAGSTCRSGTISRRPSGRRFGTLVESHGAVPAQLVVERAMYADSGKERWASGTNALGTPLAQDKVITITRAGRDAARARRGAW